MSMSGWCSSSSATSATEFTKSIASAKSSNSKVRSICFFSSSHSGTFFIRSFNSPVLIKSAITAERVTPENGFATPNRAASKIENLAKIFRRIEDIDRAASGLLRQERPVAKHFFHRSDGFILTGDKLESTLARKIFGGASVFGNYRPP